MIGKPMWHDIVKKHSQILTVKSEKKMVGESRRVLVHRIKKVIQSRGRLDNLFITILEKIFYRWDNK